MAFFSRQFKSAACEFKYEAALIFLIALTPEHTIGMPEDALTTAVMPELCDALASHGFRPVVTRKYLLSEEALLLKRQTFNTNRAVVVIRRQQFGRDFDAELKQLKRAVARECGFIPFFWGIGIQVVVLVETIREWPPALAQYLAVIDNQWAIVQSFFIVDRERGEYRSARTWGQVFTGKFQDVIDGVLARQFRRSDPV